MRNFGTLLSESSASASDGFASLFPVPSAPLLSRQRLSVLQLHSTIFYGFMTLSTPLTTMMNTTLMRIRSLPMLRSLRIVEFLLSRQLNHNGRMTDVMRLHRVCGRITWMNSSTDSSRDKGSE